VNCRIQWIIESLNAPCAPWYSEEHACLSVSKFSNSFQLCYGLWIWGLDMEVLQAFLGQLLWKALAELFAIYDRCDNYWHQWVALIMFCFQSSSILWTHSYWTFDLKSGRITRWT